MQIYIAGSFSDRDNIKILTDDFKYWGFEPTNTWQNEKDEAPVDCAKRDLNGLDEAEALVIEATTASSTGGYWVELGYALAKGIPIVVIAHEIKNVFLHLPRVQVVRNYLRAASYLNSLRMQKGQVAPHDPGLNMRVTDIELPKGF